MVVFAVFRGTLPVYIEYIIYYIILPIRRLVGAGRLDVPDVVDYILDISRM